MVLFFASFCYAMFQGGFVSWFLFASFSPIALYSIFLFFYPIHSISIARSLNKIECHAGETVKVTLKIRLPIRFPLFYLILAEENTGKLDRSGQSFTFMMNPLFKKELDYSYEIKDLPRGEHHFSGFHVRIGDLFGLAAKTVIVKSHSKMIVLPNYVDMVYRPLENQFEQGMTATRDKVQRDTTMAISIRDYQTGDRFSWIHWKATAKNNDFKTKEFEQRQSHDVLLVMDRSKNEHFELLVTYAASLIRAIIKKGAQAGLYSLGKKKDVFPTRGGESQLRTLFYHLATVEDNQFVSFAKVIESEKFLFNKNQPIVFLTSNLENEAVNQMSALLLKNRQIACFLIKPKPGRIKAAEQNLLDDARKRGLLIKIIYEGDFLESFQRGVV